MVLSNAVRRLGKQYMRMWDVRVCVSRQPFVNTFAIPDKFDPFILSTLGNSDQISSSPHWPPPTSPSCDSHLTFKIPKLLARSPSLSLYSEAGQGDICAEQSLRPFDCLLSPFLLVKPRTRMAS